MRNSQRQWGLSNRGQFKIVSLYFWVCRFFCFSMDSHSLAICKGTYVSIRPHRHTYGNYGIRLQTWTRVIVDVDL